MKLISNDEVESNDDVDKLQLNNDEFDKEKKLRNVWNHGCNFSFKCVVSSDNYNRVSVRHNMSLCNKCVSNNKSSICFFNE